MCTNYFMGLLFDKKSHLLLVCSFLKNLNEHCDLCNNKMVFVAPNVTPIGSVGSLMFNCDPLLKIKVILSSFFSKNISIQLLVSENINNNLKLLQFQMAREPHEKRPLHFSIHSLLENELLHIYIYIYQNKLSTF